MQPLGALFDERLGCFERVTERLFGAGCALGQTNGLTVGAEVDVDAGKGRIEKVYPQIEQGRVIVDVAVDGLSDTFIGQRVLVQVPVETRQVLAVPEAAIEQRAGLDLVRIKTSGGEVEVTVIPGGEVAGPDGPLREILTGLRAGDTVMVP